MRKINKTFKEIVTEIQYRDIQSNSNVISTIEAGVIYEDAAFHKLPRKFTDEIIKIVKEMKEKGYKGGNVHISHCKNEEGALHLKNRILEIYPDAQIDVRNARGLVSYYAEVNGILIGYEC